MEIYQASALTLISSKANKIFQTSKCALFNVGQLNYLLNRPPPSNRIDYFHINYHSPFFYSQYNHKFQSHSYFADKLRGSASILQRASIYM